VPVAAPPQTAPEDAFVTGLEKLKQTVGHARGIADMFAPPETTVVNPIEGPKSGIQQVLGFAEKVLENGETAAPAINAISNLIGTGIRAIRGNKGGGGGGDTPAIAAAPPPVAGNAWVSQRPLRSRAEVDAERAEQTAEPSAPAPRPVESIRTPATPRTTMRGVIRMPSNSPAAVAS
jgi:hypothetical protein